MLDLPILTSYHRRIIHALCFRWGRLQYLSRVGCVSWGALVQSASFCFVFQLFFCVAVFKRSSTGVKLEEKKYLIYVRDVSRVWVKRVSYKKEKKAFRALTPFFRFGSIYLPPMSEYTYLLREGTCMGFRSRFRVKLPTVHLDRVVKFINCICCICAVIFL